MLSPASVCAYIGQISAVKDDVIARGGTGDGTVMYKTPNNWAMDSEKGVDIVIERGGQS